MMSPLTPVRRVLLTVVALWLGTLVMLAQRGPSPSNEYTPTVGQPGKDVVWAPTPELVVEQMLRMANVGPRDYVIDLGSGDGRTVILAAKEFGARALGIEYNPDLVTLSNRNAERAGVTDKVKFVQADIFESDFSQATVITMYLLPWINLELRPKILDLRPGTRVVSHAFDMDDWEPDRKRTLDGRNAFLWIVPAKMAGNWKLRLPTRGNEETWALTLDQEFQMLTGRVHLPDGSFELAGGRIRGTEFRAHFIDATGSRREISGHAFSERLEGTLQLRGGSWVPWSAEREPSVAESPRT